jgi:hypothetical protein
VRDLRIDLFRGFALYMVVVDHIGDDPLSKFTYRIFGFSDAAEIFVYLSGMVCGLAYSSVLERKGWGTFMRVLAGRAVRIYFYYVLSSAAMMLLTAGAGIWRNEIPVGDYASSLATDPVKAILWTLSLISPPDVSDILVFYVAMTLFAVPVFMAGFRHNAQATLAASALIWGISQIFSSRLVSLEDYWAMNACNPFAWQFLFAIGMFFGVKQRSIPLDLQSSLAPVAWTIVVGAFLYKFIIYISPHFGFDVESLRISPSTLSDIKTNLSALRLIHFLSVALLVKIYFEPTSRLLQWPVFSPAIQIGARPLEIYSLTLVLSKLGYLFGTIYHPTLQSKIVMDGMFFVLMTLAVAVFPRPKMQPSPPPIDVIPSS